MIGNTKTSSWKSKGLSDESINPSSTSDNSFSPFIDYLGDKTRPKFNISCLRQPKLKYSSKYSS